MKTNNHFNVVGAGEPADRVVLHRHTAVRSRIVRAFTPVLLACVVQTAWSAGAHAQYGLPYGSYAPYPVFTHVEAYHHDSTAEGNALRGRSLLHRSLGERHYLNSLAACNYQQAAALNLVNRQELLAWNILRHEPRRQRLQAQLEARVWARWWEQYERSRQNRQADARPKTDTKLFLAEEKRVCWPDVLARDDSFAVHRQELDRLFAQKGSSTTGSCPDWRYDVEAAVERMEVTLKGQIREMHSQHYVDAARFLRLLKKAPHQGVSSSFTLGQAGTPRDGSET